MIVVLIFIFFFFQAEDGIRDKLVTGVQTCALPISLAGLAQTFGSADGTGSDARFDHPYGVAVDGSGSVYVGDVGNSTIRKRSEERRVGKEGRSRGAPYH